MRRAQPRTTSSGRRPRLRAARVRRKRSTSRQAAARREPEHGEQTDDTSRTRACRPAASAASTPPATATGKVRKHSVASRQLPKQPGAGGRSRSRRAIPIAISKPRGCVSPETTAGVVLEREVRRPGAVLDVAHHGAAIPAADGGAHVDVARDGLALDDARIGRDADRRPRRPGGRDRRPGVSISSC